MSSLERGTPNSMIAPANAVYQKASHPGPSPVVQLPNMPGGVSAAQLPHNPIWYNPHPCMPGVTSCSSALAAPVYAAAGFLTLPAQAVEWQRPSWPVAPALALPLAGGPARGSVVQPMTQPVTRPIVVWAMQHDDSRGVEQKRKHNSLNRKRTSSTNHLVEELSKRIPSTQAHLTDNGPKRSKLDILEDVLAWVEASHGWFADAGVKPFLPSADESVRHSLRGACTSVVRRKQRLDPSPTEVETPLGPAPTEGSVASDDTESESCKSSEGDVKTNDLGE